MSETISTSIARTMTPFNDSIALRMWPEAQQRASGLWLPEGARLRYDLAKCATVVDCGPHVRDLSPGDDVLVAPFHDGVEIDVPGMGPDGEPGRFRVVRERAIVAMLSTQRPIAALLGEYARATAALHARGYAPVHHADGTYSATWITER